MGGMRGCRGEWGRGRRGGSAEWRRGHGRERVRVV